MECEGRLLKELFPVNLLYEQGFRGWSDLII